MGRLGTLIFATSLLVPAGALADARATSGPEMCSDSPALSEAMSEPWFFDADSAPASGPETGAETAVSLTVEGAGGGSSADHVVLLAPLDAVPSTVLWCMTPDDPRCSPNNDGNGGHERAGGELVRFVEVPEVPPAPLVEMSHLRSNAGGPCSAHRRGIDRPPRS